MNNVNELVAYEEKTVVQCLSDKDGLKPLIEEVTQAVKNFEHDMTTASSRAKTASLAHKVAKFKTAIDGMGKDLVSDWKLKAKAVDANRKAMRDAMDELKVEARKPLDEWEAEQKRLKDEEDARIEAEKNAIQIEADHEIAILLNREHDRLKKEEEENAARLAQEAKEKAEREQKERDDAIAKEAAEQARIEAENKARLEAEAAAKREADAKAALELAERNRIAAEEKAKQDAIQAEADKKAAVKAAEEKVRQDAINKKLEEEAAAKKREDDQVHKSKINNAALKAIVAVGIDETLAKELIIAIHLGQIPNVNIMY